MRLGVGKEGKVAMRLGNMTWNCHEVAGRINVPQFWILILHGKEGTQIKTLQSLPVASWGSYIHIWVVTTPAISLEFTVVWQRIWEWRSLYFHLEGGELSWQHKEVIVVLYHIVSITSWQYMHTPRADGVGVSANDPINSPPLPPPQFDVWCAVLMSLCK